MIFILSASARISETIARSHRLERSQYRHVFEAEQLKGMEGQVMWLTPSAYRLRAIEEIVDIAKAYRLNVIEMDINREEV